jgi:carboxylesterase type B
LNSTILSTGITWGKAPGPSRIGWIVDGDIIRNSPYNAFFQHSQPLLAPIEIIVGATSDEGIGVMQIANINTVDELTAAVAYSFGLNLTQASELVLLYPIDAPAPPYSVPMTANWTAISLQAGVQASSHTRRAYAIFGDVSVIAGTRLTASSWSSLMPNQKTYAYRFDTAPTHTGVGFATHGSDMPFIFRQGTSILQALLPDVLAMLNVSYAMQATYVSFAADGNPNRHGLGWIPEWPEYGAKGGGVNMVFNATLDNLLNLHVEEDDFRQAGIGWINERQLLLSKQLQPRW